MNNYHYLVPLLPYLWALPLLACGDTRTTDSEVATSPSDDGTGSGQGNQGPLPLSPEQQLVQDLIKAEKYTEATTVLEELLPQRPTDFWWQEKLAWCYAKLRRSQQALELYRKVEAWAVQQKDWVTAARVCTLQTPLQDNHDKDATRACLDRARSYLAKAQGPGQAKNHELEIECARHTIETARFDASNLQWDRAEGGYREAASKLDRLGARDLEGVAWKGLGDTLLQQGILHEAKYAYQQARQAFKLAEFRRGMASLNSSLGSLNVDLGEPGPAIDEFRQAKRIQLDQDNPSAANSSVGIAEALMEMGALDSAQRELKDAHKIYVEDDKVQQTIPALIWLLEGEILRRQGKPRDALNHWNHPVNFDELDESQKWYLKMNYGRACEAIGDLDCALEHYRAGVTLVDGLASGLRSPELKTYLVARPWPLYDGIIAIYHARGEYPNALEWMERARSQAHRQLMMATGVRRDLAAGDASSPPGQPRKINDEDHSYSLNLGEYSRVPGSPAKTIVYHVLGSDHLTASDEPMREGVLIYTISGESVQGQLVSISRQRLTQLVNTHNELLNKNSLDEQHPGLTLSDILLKPVADTITSLTPNQRLAIVPHDVLHQVAFQTLYLNDSRLVELVVPIYLTQLGDLFRLRNPVRPRKGKGLLVVTANDPSLAGTGHTPFCARDAGFDSNCKTYPNLASFQRDAEGARSIHIIAHGEGAELGQPGKLNLGNKAYPLFLDAYTIRNCSFQAEEVILSSCLARWAPITGGDDLLGVLNLAFLYGGAASVVAARDLVAQEADSALMGFYHHFRQQTGPAEALTLAQRCMMRLPAPESNPQHSVLLDPGEEAKSALDLRRAGYWGGFSFTGDPGPVRAAISAECPVLDRP